MDVGDEKQELMFHVMRGVAKPHTLKIRKGIKGLTVVTLIDNGASHNFISKETATKLGLNGGKRKDHFRCVLRMEEKGKPLVCEDSNFKSWGS